MRENRARRSCECGSEIEWDQCSLAKVQEDHYCIIHWNVVEGKFIRAYAFIDNSVRWGREVCDHSPFTILFSELYHGLSSVGKMGGVTKGCGYNLCCISWPVLGQWPQDVGMQKLGCRHICSSGCPLYTLTVIVVSSLEIQVLWGCLWENTWIKHVMKVL